MPIRADQVIRLSDNEQILGEYHFASDDRKPYFHPLYLPPLTAPITCFRPWDHIWHRGLWFAWKYLNGVNFWEEGAQISEPQGQVQVVASSPPQARGTRLQWDQQLEWVTDAGAQALFEARELSFQTKISDGVWAIDWKSVFTAPARIEINRTDPSEPHTPWGGYGGLALRLGRDFWARPSFLDSEHRTEREQIHGSRARWLDQSGRQDGSSESWQQCAGIAIFDHPQNPRHPTVWYALAPMLVCPALTYLAPFYLDPGEQLSLQYRVFAHLGKGESERLETAYQEWIAEG